eukprot:s292_g14.t1
MDRYRCYGCRSIDKDGLKNRNEKQDWEEDSVGSFHTQARMAEKVPPPPTPVRSRALCIKKLLPRWNIPRDANSCCQVREWPVASSCTEPRVCNTLNPTLLASTTLSSTRLSTQWSYSRERSVSHFGPPSGVVSARGASACTTVSRRGVWFVGTPSRVAIRVVRKTWGRDCCLSGLQRRKTSAMRCPARRDPRFRTDLWKKQYNHNTFNLGYNTLSVSLWGQDLDVDTQHFYEGFTSEASHARTCDTSLSMFWLGWCSVKSELQGFLDLCCELCFDSACVLSQELLRQAQAVWAWGLDFLSAAHICQSAFLAAAVVLLQMAPGFQYSPQGLPALQKWLEHDLSWSSSKGAPEIPKMDPFPFASEFLIFYQSFAPTSLLPNCWQSSGFGEYFRVGCSSVNGFGVQSNCFDQAESKPTSSNALLPSNIDLSTVGCATAASDGNLALRCRSRAYDTMRLARHQPVETEAPSWECPALPVKGNRNKYSLQPERSCADGLGTWGAKRSSQKRNVLKAMRRSHRAALAALTALCLGCLPAFVSCGGPQGLRATTSRSLRSGTARRVGSEEAGRIIILGAGLQGAALAYFLTRRGVKPVVVERDKVAAAASGKGGGFLARDWGDSITRKLHTVSFKLHEELAETLGIESYRKLPVLSAAPGPRSDRASDMCPWLDGEVADVRVMDPNGAQVAPLELCTKLMDAAVEAGAELRIGTAEGVETAEDGDIERVTGVIVDGETLPADKVCVCLGPWAALAQDWFGMPVPMTGVKSSSIVFKSLA